MTAITSTGTGGNWSNTATWSPAQIPTSADAVTIAADTTVTVDTAAACLSLTLAAGAAGHVGGTLTNATGANISLTVENGISTAVSNSAKVSSAHVHFDMSGDPTHTLTLTFNNSGNATTQSFTGNGGEIYLKGAPRTRWAKSTSGITGGTSGSAHVGDASGWRVGDQLVISTTQDHPSLTGTAYQLTSTTASSSYNAGTNVLTVHTSTTLTGLIVPGQHVIGDAGGASSTLQSNLVGYDAVVQSVSANSFTIFAPSGFTTITDLDGFWFVGPKTDKATIASITYDAGSSGPATITFSNTDNVSDTTKVVFDHATGAIVGNFTSNLVLTTPKGNKAVTSFQSGNANYIVTAADVIKDVLFLNLGLGGGTTSAGLCINSFCSGFANVDNNAAFNCSTFAFQFSFLSLGLIGSKITFTFDSNIQYTEISAVTALSTQASTNTSNAVFPTGIAVTKFVSMRSQLGINFFYPSVTYDGLQISGCTRDFAGSTAKAVAGGALGALFTNSNFWSNYSVCGLMGASELTTLRNCYIGSTPDFSASNMIVHLMDTHCQTIFDTCPLNVGSVNLTGTNSIGVNGLFNRPDGTYVQFLNKNADPNVQEYYTNNTNSTGAAATSVAIQREYAATPQNFTHSTSAMLMTFAQNAAIKNSVSVLSANGVQVNIVGYMAVSRVGASNYGTSTYPFLQLTDASGSVLDTKTYADVSTASASLSVDGAGVYTWSGNFTTAGFAVGDSVLIEGFATAANNGTKTVKAVGTTTLTVFEATSADSIAAARSITRWSKVTLSGTQSSGADANMTLTFTAQSANAGAKAWFAGVPIAPYVSRVRHYGYLFDETVPTRTSNVTVSAAYATALSYAGIAVAWGSPSPVTTSADHTFQELYDYTQAWACQNVTSALPLTGAGVAGSPALFAAADLTINTGHVVNGSGSISMGSNTLSTEFTGAHAYTYTGGTWSQATTVPSYNGGTLTMPAEGTYTFSATSPVIVLNPTANGATYDLSGCTFSGTVTFHNATAHTVTVDVPSGTTTSTTGNTGGAITISAPQVFQSVTVTGLTAGSRIQIYDTTNGSELYNAVVAGTSHTWTNPTDAATYGAFNVRLRVAYCTSSTANVFVDTPIGTCGTSAPSNAISFLVSPVVDSVYVNNLIDGTAITDCAISGTALHVDVNAGSTSWQHIYAFMTAWLFTSGGIHDQYLEMTAVDQTHYVFSSAHGGQFKIKNVTSPPVPLLITGGNAVPDSGTPTDILDTSGGTIFCIEGTVVSFNSSDQSLNLATAQAAIDSRFDFPVTKRPAVDVDYVNAIKVNGTGAAASPWGP